MSGRTGQVSRRTALLSGVSVAAVWAAVLAGCAPAPTLPRLRIAGGENGGFFLEYARLLADRARARNIAEHARALTTGGSLAAIDLVLDEDSECGIAMLDAAALARDDGGTGLCALGRISQNSMHLAVPAESDVRSVQDLAGTRIATGGPLSGTSLTAGRLLAAAGLGTERFVSVALGLNAGLDALAAGEVSALVWSGGAPTPSVAKQHAAAPIRLLPLGDLVDPLRREFGPLYDRVVIPAGAYAGIPRTETVGVPTLLLANDSLPETTAAALAGLLVRDAGLLVPADSQSLQFLGLTEIVQTGPVPLHPGAARAFRDLHV
ncbi:hypothetical protein U746_1808 [Mycolicibacterium mucogenicum 261Sha1.1M5]|nr:hypothetical protein U746_1808 [Mycolicibacterium mucogenicum 261Sha1.1M5]